MILIKHFSKLIIGLVIVVCFWYGKNLDNWSKDQVINNDVVSYYAYLPAGLIFHDLNFDFIKNLPEGFKGKIWVETAPNGKPILRMTMGLAILWLPFFLVAHFYAKIAGFEALGYSLPYSFAIFAATIFYLFIGLLYLRKTLLLYFSEIISGFTILLVVLGTNLIYYVISEPGMSHVYSFTLIIIFFYYTLKWINKPDLLLSIVLGSLAGLIVLIRPVNGIILIFPALTALNSLADFKSRVISNWKYILYAGLAAILVVLPQLVYWKAQTGHVFFNSYMDSGKFYFLSPNVIDGLFSFRKGWLIYTPVMFFSIAGLFLLKNYSKGLARVIVIFLAIYVYVIFSWWCWWYGGSFGSRPMIDTYGILAIPLAAFLNYLMKKAIWKRALLGVSLVLLIALNQKQMSQYRTSLLHWDSMTWDAYKGIFMKTNWPEGYDKMIEIPDYEKALKGEEE